MAKSRGFKGRKHSLETRAKISATMRAKKGPTRGLDGPSNLGGGGGSGVKLVQLKPRGPIRTMVGVLGSQIKQDVGNKVRSALMLRPDLAPDERSVKVTAERRKRNSGGRERYMDTVTISRGTDYRTGRVYEKYRRPVSSRVRAAAGKKVGTMNMTGGRGTGTVRVSSRKSRGL